MFQPGTITPPHGHLCILDTNYAAMQAHMQCRNASPTSCATPEQASLCKLCNPCTLLRCRRPARQFSSQASVVPASSAVSVSEARMYKVYGAQRQRGALYKGGGAVVIPRGRKRADDQRKHQQRRYEGRRTPSQQLQRTPHPDQSCMLAFQRSVQQAGLDILPPTPVHMVTCWPQTDCLPQRQSGADAPQTSHSPKSPEAALAAACHR